MSGEVAKADSPKPEKAKGEARAPMPDLGERIRIKELRFCRPNGLEVPIPGGDRQRYDQRSLVQAHDGKASKNTDGGVTEIVLIPRIRRYAITYRDGNNKQPPFTFTIPESWALDVPEW